MKVSAGFPHKPVMAMASWVMLASLAGCQEWMAQPVRLEQNYGESVRVAMAQQIYDPARALHPDPAGPEGLADGIKSIKVLQRGYQSDIGQPQRIRQQQGYSVLGGGGGGSGGGGGGGGGSGGGGSGGGM